VKVVSGRAFTRLLEKRGWMLLRIKGSHHIYGKEGEPARISVPVHGQVALKAGLQRYVMKMAGMDEDDL
jgi:predicted RNA binding protein YcfA (HicA-like mRNA interferase family)